LNRAYCLRSERYLCAPHFDILAALPGRQLSLEIPRLLPGSHQDNTFSVANIFDIAVDLYEHAARKVPETDATGSSADILIIITPIGEARRELAVVEYNVSHEPCGVLYHTVLARELRGETHTHA
jgi:hypothetical protein